MIASMARMPNMRTGWMSRIINWTPEHLEQSPRAVQSRISVTLMRLRLW
jgi:hypothetical protein